MKKILCTSITLVLLQTAALAHAAYSVHNFKGHYGYSFSAEPFGTTSSDNFLTEVGVFSADGHGHLIGAGNTTISNGNINNSDVSYDCSYTVNPNGTGTLTCILTRGIEPPIPGVKFFFVLDDEGMLDGQFFVDNRQEVRFHSINELPLVTSGVTLSFHAIGSARRQY